MTLILTRDITPYQDDECIMMHGSIDVPILPADLTYILFTTSWTSEDSKRWEQVEGRLVVVADKYHSRLDKLKLAVVDERLTTTADNLAPLRKALRTKDRDESFALLADVPLALLDWGLDGNVPISVARDAASAKFMMDEKYYRAVVAFGAPRTGFQFPRRF